MEKSGGQAGGVPIEGILVDLGSRKIKLEGEKFTEDDLCHVSVKVENDLRVNDGTTGDGGLEETFTVTQEQIDATLSSAADGQDQRSSCACQEEIEMLKCTLKQLAFKTKKQNEMIERQNEMIERQNERIERQNQIIGGIKSCIRNFAVSFTTFCDNDDNEDVDNLEELENLEGAGSTAEDPQQLRNSDAMFSAQKTETSDDFQKCFPVTIVNCTGNYNGSTQIPSVPSLASSASSETCSKEAGYMVGQRNSEDKTADVYNVNLEDDDDKDRSYVPDESEEEEDQEREDGNSYHGASGSIKSVKRKGDFKCWKCCKSFKSKKYLDKHMGRVHPRIMIKCHLCPKLFTDARYLRNHIQSVHEGIRYKCTYCPGKFNKIANVRRHEEKIHKKGGPPKIQCEICGIHLLNSSGLNIHMSRMHKDSEFSTRIQSTIITTAMTNRTKTVFRCQLCPASFPDIEGLHSHQSQVHHGRKRKPINDA